MQLDWFTVGAQVVNFLVLVLLLKRFLYRPVLRAMDLREQRIAERVHKADAALDEAERLKRSYEISQQTLESERDRLMLEARHAAERHHTSLMDQLRRDIEAKRSAWEADLKRDRDLYLADLTRMVGGEVMSIARRALGDLADTDLEQAMIRSFLSKIESDGEEMASVQGDWTIITGFEVTPSDRATISARLGKLLPGHPTLRFECEPNTLCGIALECGGRRWAWNMEGYLRDLEHKVADALSRATVTVSGMPRGQTQGA